MPIFNHQIGMMQLAGKTLPSCNCSKILVVDDNEFNFYSLNILLDMLGYSCVYANNGQAAIDKVMAKEKDQSCPCNFRIILMDC